MYDAEYCTTLHNERKKLLGLLRETRFTTLKPGFSHSQVIPLATYSPWFDDDYFLKVYAAIKESTLVDVYRCFELYSLLKRAEHVSGAVVEVGVWRGGTAALLAASAPSKQIHLFDTFSGVAKANDEYDTLYKGGEHADVNFNDVKTLLSQFTPHAHLHRGLFPDEHLAAIPDLISFAHIDVDTHNSAKESFYAIWPRMKKGGIVVFDDYGFFGCEGVTQAVNDLLTETKDAFFVHNQNGHAVLYKSE